MKDNLIYFFLLIITLLIISICIKIDSYYLSCISIGFLVSLIIVWGVDLFEGKQEDGE